ncbi:putative integral membrane protein [Phaeomoniella chlamydospora]|uniref:Putative integral membrane protein n=1 Tax=Phaeomoniella chlamydospora TaxID=158046 RepID=A0A0G2GBT0_PHACM|nr:putative integral membrane protein [Phaeomoniella chlamydospora]
MQRVFRLHGGISLSFVYYLPVLNKFCKMESISRPQLVMVRSSEREVKKDGRVASSLSSSSEESLRKDYSLVSEKDLEKGTATLSQDSLNLRSQQRTPDSVGSTPTRQLYDFLRLVVFTVYRQLFSLVVLGNVIGIIILLAHKANASVPPLQDFATAAAANLLVAILVRQDYIKNAFFAVCWSIPHTAPLWLRRRLAKVYEYGGMHSSAAICATVWFIVFSGFLTKDFVTGVFRSPAVLTIDYALLTLLISICLTALPSFRARHHNVFENMHRLGGWTALALFWPELVLFARQQSMDSSSEALVQALINLPAFWMLLIITVHIILPWLQLRKVPVIAERLSEHAIRLYLPTEKIPDLRGTAVSDSPLHEWHGFAVVPDYDGTGPSILVSNAGDWTNKTIQTPKSHYYLRGLHQTGVLAMSKVFRSVVLVATGSGIGPCLAVLNDKLPQTKFRVIWSTPNPEKTFGKKICNLVKGADDQAIIIDTKLEGRPDLIGLAHRLYIESQAEAVFFISNKRLTKLVVQGLEKRGVRAFAPIFDS